MSSCWIIQPRWVGKLRGELQSGLLYHMGQVTPTVLRFENASVSQYPFSPSSLVTKPQFSFQDMTIYTLQNRTLSPNLSCREVWP